MSSVGIIANPNSGKDIRRLVAHGSSFDNNEKISIVRRVLLGLDALGVERVHYMPEGYAIVARAAETVKLSFELLVLPMAALGVPADSTEAGQRLADLGVGCLVTLGGDGTNRVAAKGCGDLPLVAISTGTNNVFPRMVEATLAGLAAGLVATGAVPDAVVLHRHPWLDIYLDGKLHDRALIDVVTTRHTWIGTRALWDPAHLSEIVLSRVTTSALGTCSLGGLLFPEAHGSRHGAHLVLGPSERTVLAPLAPGLLCPISVAAARLLVPGERVQLAVEPCTVALDGEREFELIRPGHLLEVELNPTGPRVVDIDATLRAAARRGVFVREASRLATG
jgi:predicted polyphosphate/ATP-dependent NAD kinase